MIKHNPLYSLTIPVDDIAAVEPNANVNYICSTELTQGGQVMDIWRTDLPFVSTRLGETVTEYLAVSLNESAIPWPYIPSKEEVESLTFIMVPDEEGNLQYSRGQGDRIEIHSDSIVDGGRFDPTYEGDVITYRIVDGEFQVVA